MTIDDMLEQSQWDLFWLPSVATVVDRPEIKLVYAPVDMSYLNAVFRTRASADGFDALVAEVIALHEGVRSTWKVPEVVDTAALRNALARGGYQPVIDHRACAIGVDAYAPRRGATDFRVVEVADEATLRDAIRVLDGAFGPPAERAPHYLRDELAGCTAAGGRTRRFVAYDTHDEPVATGGINAYPALGFGLLWGGGTVPAARHRGAYSAVVAARVAHARRDGLRWVGLNARVSTSLPVVRAQGFTVAGRVMHWLRSGRGGP